MACQNLPGSLGAHPSLSAKSRQSTVSHPSPLCLPFGGPTIGCASILTAMVLASEQVGDAKRADSSHDRRRTLAASAVAGLAAALVTGVMRARLEAQDDAFCGTFAECVSPTLTYAITVPLVVVFCSLVVMKVGRVPSGWRLALAGPVVGIYTVGVIDAAVLDRYPPHWLALFVGLPVGYLLAAAIVLPGRTWPIRAAALVVPLVAFMVHEHIVDATSTFWVERELAGSGVPLALPDTPDGYGLQDARAIDGIVRVQYLPTTKQAVDDFRAITVSIVPRPPEFTPPTSCDVEPVPAREPVVWLRRHCSADGQGRWLFDGADEWSAHGVVEFQREGEPYVVALDGYDGVSLAELHELMESVEQRSPQEVADQLDSSAGSG